MSKTLKKSKVKTATENAAKPRKRVQKRWSKRRLKTTIGAVTFSLVLGLGWWSVNSGMMGRGFESLRWKMIAISADMGLIVDDILVVGRKQTSQAVLLKAVRLARGAPILAFNLNAAKSRVENLPWVRTATIERMFPGTVLLRIDERKPLALWQQKGRFHLIDFNGDIIKGQNVARFADLPVVVGTGAPARAAELIATLSSEPEMMNRVEAAVWVGERRWNLMLKGNVDVRLPEENASAAWKRLADYQKKHNLLERGVRVLDLRIPDRLIVQKVKPERQIKKVKGQET